jgi:hypothetical protein
LGRLKNKPLKRQQDYTHDYSEENYIKAMKKFQIETRGMLKDSVEFTAVRNKIYSELRQEKGN